jgi:hypothetical protein
MVKMNTLFPALRRIVVAKDVAMKYRIAALQAIVEMDGVGEVMTEQDVHEYTNGSESALD